MYIYTLQYVCMHSCMYIYGLRTSELIAVLFELRPSSW